MAFTMDNTSGYTKEQIAKLNEELAQRLEGVEKHTDEYTQIEKSFADEVASR